MDNNINNIFNSVTEAICNICAARNGKQKSSYEDSSEITEKPSVDWSILKTDIEGLSAAQLILVLNLISEMKKANEQDNAGSS